METYKLLSLDIWDTILRRKCHPDEVKLHTARYFYLKYFMNLKDEFKDIYKLLIERRKAEGLLGQQSIANGFDDEYSLNDVFTILIQTVLSTNVLDVERVVEELINVELEQELNVTYLDSEIVNTVNKYKYEKLAYISDFYASTNFIDKLLEKNKFPLTFDYKIVSSDAKYNKRSGNLFLETQKRLNIKPEMQLHIGDNPHSDYQIPSRLGIQGLEFINQNEKPKKDEINQYFEFRDREPRKITYFENVSKIEDRDKNNILKQYGEESAIFFFNFILNIIEECLKQNIDKIYYFTREGEFFKKIHDEIEKVNPFGIPLPRAELLEVSRIATFTPSLNKITLDEMMRVWNMYSSQSIRAFFTTLNIESQEFEKVVNEYSIDLDEVIQYPWLDVRVQKLFNDGRFTENINKIINYRRDNLLKYFNSKGITQDKGKLAIVDIGWRGTIQDNLAYILPEKEIYGYYLGLFTFINTQPANVKKHSFVTGHAMNFLKHVAPLEMICNSPNGSVISYEFQGEEIKAIKKVDENENKIFVDYISHYQDGVLSKIKDLADKVRNHALISNDLKELAFKALENIITNPDKELTNAFFNLSHNEMFGVGSFIDKRVSFPIAIFIKALISKNGKREFLNFLESTTWPQGFLVKNNLNYIKKLYNLREKKLSNNNN